MGALGGLFIAGPAGAIVGAGVGAAATAGPTSNELALKGVQFPSGCTQVQGNTTFFAIDVYAQNGKAWRVMKSESEFNSLRSTLKNSGGVGFVMAENQWFGVVYPLTKQCLFCEIKVNSSTEDKRYKLEAWLDHFIKKGDPHWDRPLENFLQMKLSDQVPNQPQQPQQMQMQQPHQQQNKREGPLSQPLMQESRTEQSTIEKLKELATLHQTGILTDEEFSSAKAKVLAAK